MESGLIKTQIFGFSFEPEAHVSKSLFILFQKSSVHFIVISKMYVYAYVQYGEGKCGIFICCSARFLCQMRMDFWLLYSIFEISVSPKIDL